ncbi:MAG TPA: secretin N-terminal domain-containing protein [Thermoguttaceae bacterium]|nr:secretin N-terminal domain-containing protein [Thermoguttaceae bacterium]
MSVLRSHGRLLLVAVPLGLLVAAVTGLLLAGGDGESGDRSTAPIALRQAKSLQAASLLQPHQVAQAAVSSPRGDETGTAAKPRPLASQSVLKIYRCRPGSADSVAARLHEEFGRNPSVRVVPDQRTSQVLVMAPPDVQSQIADRLPEERTPGAASESPRSNAPSSPRSSANAGPVSYTSQEVQLWHTTGEQFEAALVRMLADRLTPVASTQPDASTYRLTLAGGQALRLSVDRRSNRVKIEGAADALGTSIPLLHVLDSPEASVERSTRLLSLKAGRTADVERVIHAIQTSQSLEGTRPDNASASDRQSQLRLAMAYQQPDPSAPAPVAKTSADTAPAPPAPAGQPPATPEGTAGALVPGGKLAEGVSEEGGLIGAVQIEILPGTDILVIRGHERDVQKVVQLIEQIEQISEIEKPVIEVYHLLHVDCRSLGTLLNKLYEEVFSVRQGDVSITALAKPNAVLLIGRQESVDTVIDLIKRLDRPVPPTAQFQVFRLKNTPAETAQESLVEFFEEQDQDEEGGLATRVQITADFRTNSLVVRASPRDMAEVAAIIERIDAPENETVNEVRIFKLKNSLAEDLAPVLQDAITAQMYGQRTGQRAVVQRTAGMGEQFERKSIRLQFVTTDDDGQRTLNSGILTDVLVTADTRANALIITASADSMPLIAALINQLDQLPTAEAQVKVFTIVHGDASNLLDMLGDLFGTQTQATEPAVRTGATDEDSSLVFLRFAVDVRTNSIIATGSTGDLVLVEAILLRLDESDLRMRQTVVMRLKNASAENVANAVNEFLSSELEAEQPVQGLLSSIEQTDREVVLVPEAITNALIISATERFYDRIIDLVEKLDARPPMVVIQVLLAAVTLDDTDEFGVELGLQDSILFDRSISNIPGFLFNNTTIPLGNNTTAAGSNIVGTQGLSSLALGRQNSDLGYGGLVISASSEAVSVLIRALQENRRLDVLARPQIMTVDTIEGIVHVGENVPTITSVSPATNLGSQTFNIEYVDVGIQLNVIPRINPDGLVVMQVTASRSKVGPEEDGIPISVAADGSVLRAPRIEIAEAQSTVSAMDGQTVILGGLITKDTSEVHRQVPWLGDVPVLGRLFRYDSVTVEKTELLIILTPHVVENEEDAEVVKQIEAARMNWCLADVLEVHGDPFDRTGQTPVIYPDLDPSAQAILAPKLAPEDQPSGPDEADQTPFIMEPLPPAPEQKGATSHQAAPAPEQGVGIGPGSTSNPVVSDPRGDIQRASYDQRVRLAAPTAPQSSTRYRAAGTLPFTNSQTSYAGANYPVPSYPATSYPATTYPATTYPATSYPATSYPATSYQPASNPVYPPMTYPETGNPATRYPAGVERGARSPATDSPATDRPSTVDPRYGYGPTGPSFGTTPPARYDVEGYTRYSEPGVARFQGGIGKPTGTDVHNYDRSSVY